MMRRIIKREKTKWPSSKKFEQYGFGDSKITTIIIFCVIFSNNRQEKQQQKTLSVSQ